MWLADVEMMRQDDSKDVKVLICDGLIELIWLITLISRILQQFGAVLNEILLIWYWCFSMLNIPLNWPKGFCASCSTMLFDEILLFCAYLIIVSRFQRSSTGGNSSTKTPKIHGCFSTSFIFRRCIRDGLSIFETRSLKTVKTKRQLNFPSPHSLIILHRSTHETMLIPYKFDASLSLRRVSSHPRTTHADVDC